jgi:hypothetical protein
MRRLACVAAGSCNFGWIEFDCFVSGYSTFKPLHFAFVEQESSLRSSVLARRR